MHVQFREKASIAYETMPPSRKEKAALVIKMLTNDQLHSLDSKKISADTWVARVDSGARLLFQEVDQGFIIIDIIDLKKESYSAHTA